MDCCLHFVVCNWSTKAFGASWACPGAGMLHRYCVGTFNLHPGTKTGFQRYRFVCTGDRNEPVRRQL